MNIDDAVVISLPARRARLAAFLRGLPADWPFPVPRVVPGVVAEPPPYWRVSPGAYGCALAHVNVLQTAYRAGVQNLLVLEDDAVFPVNFGTRWRTFAPLVPDPWSMIMLGGQHDVEPRITGRVARCLGTRRTHAYVVSWKAMPLLIRTWSRATTHIDHYLAPLQQQMQVYAPTPFMVGQRAGRSDTTGSSHMVDRFWMSVSDRGDGLAEVSLA